MVRIELVDAGGSGSAVDPRLINFRPEKRMVAQICKVSDQETWVLASVHIPYDEALDVALMLN
ncbi:unnamed protein product [Arabidopsis thaliana]|uniref:Uncharacterized protein n=1 Tax=Arabidopsis thaliana TaxID=3702 RepID=A0A5S9WRC7_ARATH|nr:unnamed protein product [Arabidopsis thaliana]